MSAPSPRSSPERRGPAAAAIRHRVPGSVAGYGLPSNGCSMNAQVPMTNAWFGSRTVTGLAKPTRPVILPGRREPTLLVPRAQSYRGNRRTHHVLVRFRTQAVASVTATMASTTESTIESRVSRLLGGDFFEKTSGT